MKKIAEFVRNKYKSIIITSLVFPPIVVSIVSTAHLITWWRLSNPVFWAAFLAISIEIAALSSLAGLAVRINRRSLYVIFGLVTIIQVIGNVYFSYDYTMTQLQEQEGWLYNWINLTKPIYVYAGLDSSNNIAIARWLAYLAGAIIPTISLFFLHILVRFVDKNFHEKQMEGEEKQEDTEEQEIDEEPKKPEGLKFS